MNTFRPVERTYSTKITRFRRPQTATFRFIAHQACILYHKLPQIARVIYGLFRRIFNKFQHAKYTTCTKQARKREKRDDLGTYKLPSHFLLQLFLKKIIIIFEKCAIGHILFKFVLYNNYNYSFKKGGFALNKKQQWALFCGRLVPIASAIATFFMTFAVLFCYEKSSNYFEPNAIIPVLATIWAILGLFTAVIFAIIIPKEEITSHSPFTANLTVALPAALGFGIGAILLVIEFAKTQSISTLVTVLLLLLSAAYVLLSETDRINSILGFIPPIAIAVLVGILYFDASLEMNAPLKVAVQTALLPLMLYFTTELRYLLNREIPRLYLALALISVTLASLCILAIPVAFLTGILENTNCLAGSLVVTGNIITILLKFKRHLYPIPSPENDTKETDAQ